jgi:hypothetical protein
MISLLMIIIDIISSKQRIQAGRLNRDPCCWLRLYPGLDDWILFIFFLLDCNRYNMENCTEVLYV